jgi:hypothetical protein
MTLTSAPGIVASICQSVSVIRFGWNTTRGDLLIPAIWPRTGLIPRLPGCHNPRRLAPDRCLLPEHGQAAFDRLPVEEVIKAGPGVDFGLAEHALEAAGIAGMLVRMLLARRSVIHPAFGAGELLGCPYASHAGNMRRELLLFQSIGLPQPAERAKTAFKEIAGLTKPRRLQQVGTHSSSPVRRLRRPPARPGGPSGPRVPYYGSQSASPPASP